MDRFLDTENGNDNNNGSSIGTAFKTLGMSLSSLDPNDRLLAIGTVEIADEEEGYALSTPDVTIQSYDYANKLIIKPTEDYQAESNYGFIDLSADRIALFGLRFEDLTGDSRRRAITADSVFNTNRSVKNTGCKIANCEFYDIYDGYHGNYQDDIKIINNTFQMKNQGVHQNAIFINNVGGYVSRNDISYLNTFARTFQVGGIRFGTASCNNAAVNNTVHDINCTLAESGFEADSGGIAVDGNSYNNLILNNTLYNINYEISEEHFPLGAILIKGPNNKIINNLIVGCTRAFSDFKLATYEAWGSNSYKNNAYWQCDQVSRIDLHLDSSNILANPNIIDGVTPHDSFVLGKGLGGNYSTDIGVVIHNTHKRYLIAGATE